LLNQTIPPAIAAKPAISMGLAPKRLVSADARPAAMMMPTASGR
jgi:hypothetical protein